MVDTLRIEDFGSLLLGQWMFDPVYSLDAEIAFGGYTVWDIQGDRAVIHAVQQQDLVG
jgi:hypothetical protein